MCHTEVRHDLTLRPEDKSENRGNGQEEPSRNVRSGLDILEEEDIGGRDTSMREERKWTWMSKNRVLKPKERGFEDLLEMGVEGDEV